jgi:hypothetical protein
MPSKKRYTAKMKLWSALAALLCIIVGSMTDSAAAVTASIAKKCNALTARAFPPREIGNPAAGSAKGTGQAELAYNRKCVANGGNIDTPDHGEGK